MRILQLHNLQRATGGADEVIEYERGLLVASGHQVEQLFLPSAVAPKMNMALKPIYNPDFCKRLNARITAFRPDVVHIHTPFPLMSPAVFRTAKRRGCATVATLHAYRYSCVAGTLLRAGAPCELCIGRAIKGPAVTHRCYHDSRLASASMAVGLSFHHRLGTFARYVDRFIALSEFAQDIAIRDGLPPGKIVVKPNSVPDLGDAVSAFPAPDVPQVAFVGRLVAEKGIRTVAEAWLRANPALPRLAIAGDGPLRDEVRDLERRCPNVEWRGWLQEDGVNMLISSSCAVVITSDWPEGGVPLVMLRALALKRPVIASDVPNMKDLIREEGLGMTFRAGHPDSLIDVVRSAMADQGRLEVSGDRGREYYLAHHSPEANARALATVYQSALLSAHRVRLRRFDG